MTDTKELASDRKSRFGLALFVAAVLCMWIAPGALAVPPPTPSVDDTDPDSPANANSPLVKGTAEAGSTVRLYTTAGCLGVPVASGTAAEFAAPGISAAVADNSVTTFRATASNAADESSACSAGLTYVEDSIAPQTTIDAQPPDPSNDANPAFAFSSNEAGSSFECEIDSQPPFYPCGSPETVGPLGEGPHTFAVRAIDQAGNPDLSPATYTWVTDTKAPAEPILGSTAPASPANDNTPLIKGTGGPTVRIYTTAGCLGLPVASGTAAEFAAPGISAAVADNTTTTFRATATDAAGNTSACSAGLTYVEDSTPPETTIDSGPSGLTNDATPRFTFWGSSSFECRVDVGPWFACTTPYTSFALADGPHRFQVRAIDPAGNTDQSPASRDFTIDTGPPETTIDAGPAGLTSDASPRFDFSSDDTGSSFECRLDSGDWAACSPPKSYDSLVDGPHAFQARATDTIGNADASPAERSFTVDTRVDGSARAKAAQRQAGKSVVVRASARAGEDLDVTATGRIKLGKRSFKLNRKTRRVGSGNSTTVTLKPKKSKQVSKIAKALKKGRKANAKLSIGLTDKAGNSESEKLLVKLRR